jgi:UDP-4-amino-4,6-dideoxy-N-acetyl-beta-L-altrosamine transaminase
VIPYARQEINSADIEAVTQVLRSDFLTQGPVVPAFESAIALYCGAKYAIAVNSATSALHIACLSLGVTKGDLVWTSSITFAASANCAVYCGAKVDFVDIDPKTYNLSIEALEKKLIIARNQGLLPKVVIPVHLCGQSCDMERIYTLSNEYGFKIIEDASHAIGGKFKDEAIGNCRYSEITVFSFHPVKIITTAEGGMAVTNNSDLAKKMVLLRSHGITSSSELMVEAPKNEIWNYQQIDLGFHYRMTELQAALGLSQVQRLNEFVSRRHLLADRYNQLLPKHQIKLPYQAPNTYSTYHLYVVRLNLEQIRKTQRQIYEGLLADGVQANLHYIPVYRHPFYKKMGFPVGYCPEAEDYFTAALSIPLYPGLTFEQQDHVIRSITGLVSE